MSLKEDIIYGLSDLGVEAVKITNGLVHGNQTKKFIIVYNIDGRRMKAEIDLASQVLREGNSAIVAVLRSIIRSSNEEG